VRQLAGALVELASDRVAYIGVRPDGPFASLAGLESIRSTRLDDGRYLPWLLRHADADARVVAAEIVHYPIALAPIRASVPYVVTIHDLSTLRDPLHHPPLRVARLALIALSAHRARAVITPSRAAARDVVRAFGVPARRVIAVHHAPVRQLVPGERPGDREILARYGVAPGSYLFATGGSDARKNPVRLARALGRLGPEHGDLGLIIAGPNGWRHARIRAAIEATPAADRIRMAGYLPDEELEALLRNAAAFVYASLHEGFGLPILDAMRAGVPVVTSRVSSMPEVAGRAAVLVDPRDEADIARGIAAALGSREALVRAGAERVRSRTWLDVADETLEVYRWAGSRP
jgi:glycosyltransferase involved in cell wall biosynthesis